MCQAAQPLVLVPAQHLEGTEGMAEGGPCLHQSTVGVRSRGAVLGHSSLLEGV